MPRRITPRLERLRSTLRRRVERAMDQWIARIAMDRPFVMRIPPSDTDVLAHDLADVCAVTIEQELAGMRRHGQA